MRKVIENQFFILRLLASPLTTPWNRGDTRMFLGAIGIAFWLGFRFSWWIPLGVCALIVISGAIYAAASNREWEEDMLEQLRQEVLWLNVNRNNLAEKYGAYYAGLPGDDNDPSNWREYEPGQTWEDVYYGLDPAQPGTDRTAIVTVNEDGIVQP